MSSLSTCTWFLCILTIFDWTYVSHGLVLGGLSNFFLSINRATKGKSHELETGGQVLVILGIVLLFKDTVSLDINDVPEEYLTTGNHLTYHRTWWERLAADIVKMYLYIGCNCNVFHHCRILQVYIRH